MRGDNAGDGNCATAYSKRIPEMNKKKTAEPAIRVEQNDVPSILMKPGKRSNRSKSVSFATPMVSISDGNFI